MIYQSPARPCKQHGLLLQALVLTDLALQAERKVPDISNNMRFVSQCQLPVLYSWVLFSVYMFTEITTQGRNSSTFKALRDVLYIHDLAYATSINIAPINVSTMIAESSHWSSRQAIRKIQAHMGTKRW